MNVGVGDRVILSTPEQTFTGTVTVRRDDGVLSVKWDAGLTERIHESELRLLSKGAPAEEFAGRQ